MRKILTDVDGVLLNWRDAFHAWMQEQGHELNEDGQYCMATTFGIDQDEADYMIRRFNQSAWMGFLKPYKDSVPVIQDFITEGYHFEAITSLTKDHWAGELRRMNLRRWFLEGVRRTHCLETSQRKNDYLKNWEPGHWWIEDSPYQAEAGLDAGHRCLLMDSDHNRWYNHPKITRVKNWQEVFDIIVED